MAKLYEAFSVYEGFDTADTNYMAALDSYDKMVSKSSIISANITKIEKANDFQEQTGVTEDALKFDMEYMMAQQKNTSMIGMITIATLFIATVCLVGRYS